jgi:phosphoglycerate dehydrogenase-like enzyme
VTDGPLVVSTFSFSSASQAILSKAANRELLCVTRTEEFLSHLGEAEVLCAYKLPDNVRELAPRLRWLQYPGAGVDTLQTTGLLEADSGVIVTSASGIHTTNISEYVFGSMLMFNRAWPEMVRLQDRHIWPRNPNWYNLRARELAGQTLGIVGLGSIGRRVAQLGRAFGMIVLGMRRSVSSGEKDPDVDQLYGLGQLHDLLRRSDYVVLATPLTAETEKMIGAPELKAMRPNAYLVNIARGRVIDEPVLIRALKEGWIAGAGLDVTLEEPLPPDSPLFSMPNVILTPHISGVSDNYDQRLTALFAENLRRYSAGEPLLNQYDATRGY